MNYSNSIIYNVKRKKDILFILFGDENFDYKEVIKYKVKIVDEKRLVEHACYKSPLKLVQSKIHSFLSKLELPDYLFSKKGKSSVDNSKYHINNNAVAKIDISGFYPNSHRNFIYNFFLKKMNCSPDVLKHINRFNNDKFGK